MGGGGGGGGGGTPLCVLPKGYVVFVPFQYEKGYIAFAHFGWRITGAYKHICHFNSKALIQVMTTKFLPMKTCMLHFMTSSRSEKRYGF